LEQILEAYWQQKKRKSVTVNTLKPPYDRNMKVNHTSRENPVEINQEYMEQERFNRI
jgi:hypothetical protein